MGVRKPSLREAFPNRRRSSRCLAHLYVARGCASLGPKSAPARPSLAPRARLDMSPRLIKGDIRLAHPRQKCELDLPLQAHPLELRREYARPKKLPAGQLKPPIK
jgi:hypothetical protein